MFLHRFTLDFFFGSFLGFEPLATGDTGLLTRSLEQGDESSLLATGDTVVLTGSLALLTCPITDELIQDPAIASDGATYEREAIKHWLSIINKHTGVRNIRSPALGVDLENRQLIDNITVRKIIYQIADQIADEKKNIIVKDIEDSKPSANPTSESTTSNINQTNEDNDSIEDCISLMSINNEDSSPCARLPVNTTVSPVTSN